MEEIKAVYNANINFEDVVYQPKHYTAGNIETIDYIKDKLTAEQFEGYCIGNCLKYLSRYRHKNGAEDIQKSIVYAKWAINSIKGEELDK